MDRVAACVIGFVLGATAALVLILALSSCAP